MSRMGEIADKFWKTIPRHFPFVLLDEHMIMPNHIHGIIQIKKPNDLNDNVSNQDNMETIGRDAINRVSTLSNKFRWYKGRVSFETRKIHVDFAWQSRFYDHVIRNDESINRIRFYIRDNLKKWSTDQLNPDFETTQHK